MLYNIYPPCWDVWNTFYIYGSNISGTEFCSWLLGSCEPIRGEWGKTTVPAQNILGFTSSFSCAISFNRRVSCLFSQLKLGRLKLQPGGPAMGRAKSLPAPFQANSAAGGSKVFMYLWSNMLIFVVYTGLLHGNTSNLLFGGENSSFFSPVRPRYKWDLRWFDSCTEVISCCNVSLKQNNKQTPGLRQQATLFQSTRLRLSIFLWVIAGPQQSGQCFSVWSEQNCWLTNNSVQQSVPVPNQAKCEN